MNDDLFPCILRDVMLEQDDWVHGMRNRQKSDQLKCRSAALELSYRSERNLKLIKDFYCASTGHNLMEALIEDSMMQVIVNLLVPISPFPPKIDFLFPSTSQLGSECSLCLLKFAYVSLVLILGIGLKTTTPKYSIKFRQTFLFVPS